MGKDLYLRNVVLTVIPQTGTGRVIENLKIGFNIEKTNKGEPNDAEIQVYNLAEKTRSLFEAKNTRVDLAIGYLGLDPDGIFGTGINSSKSTETVFVGNIVKVEHEVERPNIVTTITAKDGGNSYRNARLDKGFPPNVSLQTIINEINEKSGLGKGKQEGIGNKTYGRGIALSGYIRDHLDTICRANGLEWSIQDESIQIVPRAKATTDSVIYLSPETGLINSPTKTEKGIAFKSLIQPTLRPGRKVQLDSKFVKGIYTLQKVTHSGDNYDGEFVSECEAIL